MFLSFFHSLQSSVLKGNSLFICLLGYIFIELLSSLLFSGSLASSAFASTLNEDPRLNSAVDLVSQPSCQPIYGGGENCAQTENITINKTVQNPRTLKYVDNLDTNDPKYNPDQTVLFQITVKNTSKASIKNIEVKDRLPQYVDCASGGAGQCNNAAKIIAFRIDNLNANETKSFTLKGKIVSKSNLPQGKETICLINQAVATQKQQNSQDNARFCINKNQAFSAITPSVNRTGTKGGLPVYSPSKTKTTPATGPEALAVVGLFASGFLGFLLRKNTSKRSK